MENAALLEQLNCCICLNIYRDPAALRCGHSFCRVCITNVLESQKSSGVYKCPRCQKEFQEEPSLQENISLRHIADHFLSTHPKQEETEILCTYCIHSQIPAVKTCVLCEASLCENHVRVHSKSPEHILSDPTTSMESRKCSVHNEILKYFCSDENVCICVSCSVAGDHKGHQVETLPEAAVKMKETLKDVLEKLVSSKKKTEQRLQILQERKTTVPETAANMKEKVAALLKNIKDQLDELEKKAMSQIIAQEEDALKSLGDLTQYVEEEQEGLMKEIVDTEELCEMTDPLSVLQACETGMDEEGKQECKITDDQIFSAGKLDEGLVSEHLHIGFCNVLNDMMKHLQIFQMTDTTLDAHTASPSVLLSNDCKSASKNNQVTHRYETPQQFKENAQVLSFQSFGGGQYYWDFDTNTSDNWIIGMSYSSIDRQGWKSWIGSNTKSWGLHKEGYTYKARHDGKEISVHEYFGQGQRIRMYLDYAAGRLSFYDISDQIRPIHTFTAAFTDSLYIALCVFTNTWIRIIN